MRDVKMYGYDVELYVEDTDIKGISGGVYSLMNDEWINEPKKESVGEPDMKQVREKSKNWMRIIDSVLNNIEHESPDKIKNLVKKYKEKIKKYRVSGLQKGGEMSIENLVFKTLRRNGYIDKLYSIPTKLIDKKLSIESISR